MSACSRCGTVAKATDKFCNVCGTPLARTGASNAPPPQAGQQYAPPGAPPLTPPPGAVGVGYAQTQAPPPQPGGVGSIARCQMGHEIAAGASYCVQGHPIALDQMQFSNEPSYGGAGPQGYGQPGAPGGYGAAQGSGSYGGPPQASYGGAQPPYVPPGASPAYSPPGAPFASQPGQSYGTPGPQGAYAPTPLPGYGHAPAQAYGAPPAPLPNDTAREAPPPKILRGFLVAYEANPSGDFWPLTGGRSIVGRLGAAEGVDISMQAPTISSRHAAMVVDAVTGSITVEDTGSTNGTFVNDEHIGFNGRRELRDGDRLRFGGYTTIVKVIGRF
jgi:pSer/pThr/pTyr-binding forkhead associated (FHA) protein